MFVFSQLQSLVKVALQLLFKSVHFVLLLRDELGLGGDDFLVPLLHVLFSLLDLKFLTHHLHLMGLSVLLLLSETFLNFLLVQKLGGEFESQGQFLLKHLAIFLDLLSVSVLELSKSLSVLLLGVEEVLVPLLVKFLVLLNMCLLTLLPLLSLIEDQLLVTAIVVLMLQLCDSVFGHLSLYVFLLMLTSSSMVFEHSNEVLDVISGWLLIKSLFHVVTLHL